MGRKAISAEQISLTIRTYRWVFIIAGVAAAVIGLLILIWPAVMGGTFSILMGIYAIGAGLLYGWMVIRGGDLAPLIRVARGFIALALIVGGILILIFTHAATAIVVNVVGVALGVLWIAEGLMAFMTLRRLKDKSWLLAYAIIAVIAGVVMLFTPAWDGRPVVWLVGFSLLGLGVAQVYRGATATPDVVIDIEDIEADAE